MFPTLNNAADRKLLYSKPDWTIIPIPSYIPRNATMILVFSDSDLKKVHGWMNITMQQNSSKQRLLQEGTNAHP